MKWHWTPKGWVIAIIAVLCLGMGGYTNSVEGLETLSNILLVLGIVFLILGYVRTYVNIKRQNKLRDEEIR